MQALEAACLGFLPEYLPVACARPFVSIVIHLKYLLPGSSSSSSSPPFWALGAFLATLRFLGALTSADFLEPALDATLDAALGAATLDALGAALDAALDTALTGAATSSTSATTSFATPFVLGAALEVVLAD